MNTTEIIVVGSAGIYPDTLVIAANRAGGRGLFQAGTDLLDILRRSATIRAAAERFGIALSEWSDRQFIQELFDKLPEGLATILVPHSVWQADANAFASIRQGGVEIFLEVDRRAQFGSVDPTAIDGLILKGNESGGRVSGTTAYILTQQWCEHCAREAASADLPFWVRGGIGVRSAAAAALAGASGVVLDSQLLLTRESPLTRLQRQFVAALDGSESVSVGSQLDLEYRICAKPGSPIIAALADREDELAAAKMDPAQRESRWRAEVWRQFETLAGGWPIFFAGPDAALAGDLANQFVTVAGVMQGIVAGANGLISQAASQQLLAAESPLAKGHATRYPILQGPMTRVSDVPEFADAVSAGGALPFLALALLREAQAEEILQKTEALLGDRSWGVGLLGFLPPEIRKEQIRAIKKHKPPFAIIAGGRPDQAKELEDDGIATYLHVPSPGLLSMFLRGGAKRFILEGRECGGHVGPRTSFLLWEQQISVLQKHLKRARDADQYHVVFAGGIHDGQSAAMAVTMAAELAQLGVRVGVLMGTAYLFTEEAVETGAIVKKFQEEVRGADQTVLFETGPGHAVRCLRTPYYDDFVSEKIRLKQAGKQHIDIVAALERMNIGRLRVASKGVDRKAPEPGAPRQLVEVAATEQHDRGMYMVGQVASMHEKVTTIAALHQQISTAAAATLEAAMPRISVTESPPEPNPCDIAIVGMSCFYPEANSIQEYWDNILQRVYAVTEIPSSHWDWRIYYDENPRAKDKIVSKWGGFLSDIPFDPLQYGITPKSIQAIEPLQLLVLEAVAHAVKDAGYQRRPFDRENTCAVLGIGGGGSAMAVNYGFRACLPLLDTVDEIDISPFDMIEACEEMLPDWTEDSFPGILMNVAVGRVANRFDLGGSNYALDAACASSLSAVHACIRELELGTANVAFAMGADTVQTPYAYVAFSKTHALSPQGRCRPFDASADGIVLSEGVGVVMLKRLADAERDGDKIYSVIRGIGSSSDGKDKGLTAPNAAGQMRALRRAYDKAGIPPSRVGLVEAHGTGTVVGDRTESAALAEVMRESNAERQSCALGSVKSMIGHSKCAAGVAGLIKATMALHHKVLPPTLVEMPNPTANYLETALFLNTETRPWIDDRREPRCAGVSAFGFGGTNVHVVMEEYTGDNVSDEAAPIRRWPSELFVYREATLADLTKSIETAIGALDAGAKTEAANYAASLWRHAATKSGPVIVIVAPSLQRLRGHLDLALAMVKKQPQSAGATAVDPRGIYFCAAPDQQHGKLAMLFPGQGSQYANMLSDVAVNFPVVRQAMDEFAKAPLIDESMDGLERPLARYIYPPSTFTEEEAQLTRQALASTEVAQPAIGAASMGMFRLMQQLGIKPDVMAGHSYGEYTALWASGAIDQRDFMRLSYRRGRLLREAAGDQTGGMAAVTADGETVLRWLEGLSGVTLANLNAPDQTVISGRNEALQQAIKRLEAQQIKVQPLQVSCAFHSPEVSHSQAQFAEALEETSFYAPQVTVYANQSAAAYPDDPPAIRETLCNHVTSPVQFRAQIEAMYAAGVRTFVEVGPHNHLTGLVKRNLGDRPHVAVSTDVSSRHGLTQLQHCLAQLLTANIPLNLDVLFDGRVTETFAPAALRGKAGEVEYSPMTHMVNGIRSRPWQAPEPRLLGQRMEEDTASSAVQTEKLRLVPKSNVTPPAPVPAAAAPSAMAKSSSLKTTTMSNESLKPSAVARQVAPDENGQPMNGQLTDGVPLAGVDPVLLGFQELMSQFLDTQRDVMLQYLGSNHVSHVPVEALQPPAHPAELADMSGPMPAAQPPSGPPPSVAGQGTALVPSQAPQNGAADAGETTAETALATLGSAVDSMEQLQGRLMEIVSERTGYPPEMLDLDLDLEADLGIDSIKRIEILGELAEGLGIDATDESTLELEKLTSERSLRGMLNYLEEALFSSDGRDSGAAIVDQRPPSPQESVAHAITQAQPAIPQRTDALPKPQDKPLEAPATESDSLDTERIQRGRVRLVEAPLPSMSAPVIPSGAVIVTDDGRGAAVELADQLGDLGQAVYVVRMSADQEVTEANGVIHADLTRPDHVDEVIAKVRAAAGPIAGLIHLLPLSPTDNGSWPKTARRDARSLYLLARAAEEDLNERAASGSAIVLAATGLGGELGFSGNGCESLQAGHGGVIGFVKCLAMEWPEVMVRAIDMNASQSIGQIVETLLSELRDPQGPLEVGSEDDRRVTWEPFSAPLETTGAAKIEINSSSVILLTGGARGITAAIAKELAQRYQPTLILAGRSELIEESLETQPLATAAEIKKALIASLSTNGSVQMSKVEVAYNKLMRCREIRENIAAMEAAGSHVEYHAVDVRDETAVKRLIEHIVSSQGRLDGVIHGAGVIEDKLVKDKVPESFDRVFGTKVDSVAHLVKYLPQDKLKFMALFSSIASRFGNRGQSDYAAANEVLSKLAAELDRRWDARVFAVAWGPWSGTGMVSDLESHLTARGITLISPAEGADHLINEILFGSKGESEIMIAGGAAKLVTATASRAST